MRLLVLLLILAVFGFVLNAGVAVTASNSVPVSSIGYQTRVQGANDLKPDDCTNSVTNLVIGSGTFSGTSSADLMLGSAGNDTISGSGGSDCILGGAGDDSLNGENGSDALIGGPGNDDCDGGPGADTFPRGDCESTS